MTERDTVRFGIAFTYNCDMSCPGCNRYLDKAKWSDSDITLEGIEEGCNRVADAGIKIRKVRVTGGEPLMYPDFFKAMKLIDRTWNKDYPARTCVFSNGNHKLLRGRSWRFRVATTVESKYSQFKPSWASPADLGYTLDVGVENSCQIQKSCGRGFDAFGFSPCILSGGLGRLLGVDPYSVYPVLKGNPDICKHCLYSVRSSRRSRLFKKLAETPTTTTTYLKMFSKVKKHEMKAFSKFADRTK